MKNSHSKYPIRYGRRVLLVKSSKNTNPAQKRSRKGLIACLICTLVAVALNVVLSVLKSNPVLSEQICLTVSKPFGDFIRTVSSQLPFSMMELLVVAVIVGAIIFLVRLIVGLVRGSGKAIRSILKCASAVLFFVAFYTMTVGFGYTRQPVQMPEYTPTTRDEAVELAVRYFDEVSELCARLDYDENSRPICPYTHAELTEIVEREYSRLVREFPEYCDVLYDGTVPVKTLVNSWLLSESNIAGIYSGPTGEANVNADMPMSNAVWTACHEVAHGKGILKEDEANAFAYLIVLTAEDDFLRFSGVVMTYTKMQDVLYYYDRELYDDIVSARHPSVLTEHWAQYNFWKAHGKIADFAESINDLYLKLSGYFKGVGGYKDPSVVTPSVNPDTGETEYEITYSTTQKMIFALLKREA